MSAAPSSTPRTFHLAVIAGLLVFAGTATSGCASSESKSSAKEAKVSVWFEGEKPVASSFDDVRAATDDVGAYFIGVVRHMPGLSKIELLKQEEGLVHIQTNEGVMKRTGIARRIEGDTIHLTYEEAYEAGSAITATAQFEETFTKQGDGVLGRLVIRSMKAPGLLGFVYRNLASKNIGNSLLDASRKHLEGEPVPAAK